MNINSLLDCKTYEEVLKWASSFLKNKDQPSHSAEWILKEQLNWSTTDLLTKRKIVMPEKEKTSYSLAILEASKGIPVQHIVGHEWFFDRQFRVTSDTLIPRPETEEWFYRYLNKLPDRPLTVLDIGTGSGVLAISHKLERPEDTVIAVDISSKALKVAEYNAKKLGAEVYFRKSDLMNNINEKFDVVISNPPYISSEEIVVMDESVIQYEPHVALFADEDGLFLYKRLAEELPVFLKQECWVILEYGYRQKNQVKKLFAEAFPGSYIEMWQDMSGNDRAIYLHRKEE